MQKLAFWIDNADDFNIDVSPLNANIIVFYNCQSQRTITDGISFLHSINIMNYNGCIVMLDKHAESYFHNLPLKNEVYSMGYNSKLKRIKYEELQRIIR